MLDRITVHGARQHNLKNIDVQIPRNTLTVITGLSGSGKSSLAFDTIYAEGQRRYVETLSPYARQFLDQMERPEVDSIDGEISRQSSEQILEQVLTMGAEQRIMILAPIVRGRKGEYKKELEKLGRQGFVRARIDGVLRALEEEITLDKRKNHTIEVVVDRLLIKPGIEKRLQASIDTATKLADGLVQVAVVGGAEKLFSQKLACPDCGASVPQLEPRSFSFNSPFGACETCAGLGSRWSFDPVKVVVDPSRPLLDGGLGPGGGSSYMAHALKALADKAKISLNKPFRELPQKSQTALLAEAVEPRRARAWRDYRRAHGNVDSSRAGGGEGVEAQRTRNADRRARGGGDS